MEPTGETPPPAPPSAPWWHVASWHLPKLPLLIGVIGLGGGVTVAVVKHQTSVHQTVEVQAIRAELTGMRNAALEYELRLRSLREQGEQFHTAVDQAASSAEKVWAQERARDFDALLAKLARDDDERKLAVLGAAIEASLARDDVAAAREALLRLPAVQFPAAPRFRELQAREYLQPLAQFSRQNPDYYRAFRAAEPEAARADVATLRAELAAAPADVVSPQAMLKFELFAAVVPPDDPVLADWAALSTAGDYFENPDAATVSAWRRAQRAVRIEDWGHAAAEMQSILRSTVRVRQPFRAAYAVTVLHSNPDDPAAYPFIVEAAARGDAAARTWVAQDSLAKGRPAEALRWLEAALTDGDPAAAEPLLRIYAMNESAVPRDPARELVQLKKITSGPDAPALAWHLLARLYESGAGGTRAPASARAAFERAAEKRYAPAEVELARCLSRGIGGPVDDDKAAGYAVRAVDHGEAEAALPLLIDLMRESPDCTAPGLQQMFERESVAAPAGFADLHTTVGKGVSQLKAQLAHYLDQHGRYGDAARFYASSGSQDPAVLNRHAEITTAHVCVTCNGTGKVPTFTPCPICGGTGTVPCGVCDGRGFSWVPGTPPCPTCGGTGTLIQDGKPAGCPACGGTGKGKGSVIKQPCPACDHGRAPCRACEGGMIKGTKECPDCHGTGRRSLADPN